MTSLGPISERHGTHDNRMYDAGPDGKPDQAPVGQRIARGPDQKEAQRRVDAEDHGPVMGVPHSPAPPAGPNNRQGLEPDDEGHANRDQGVTKSGNTSMAWERGVTYDYSS